LPDGSQQEEVSVGEQSASFLVVAFRTARRADSFHPVDDATVRHDPSIAPDAATPIGSLHAAT
jgi:hypothetical protein